VATIVIPFAGVGGKTRLHASAEVRGALATAMFEDVLAACTPVGPTKVADSGGGQGAAVAAALAGVEGPVVVVNADVPCVVPADIRLLAETAPALVAAADGTTNALSLPSADLFEPLYGPGSAARFQARCSAASMAIPNLADDVDTMEDLVRLQLRVGPRTLVALDALQRGAA
jgi:2-phospho-L-lactate guanylyltransferase (CobY/MobA/RfbA family)